MIPPLPQSHMMGMSPMHSGPVPNNSVPPTIGNFANGLSNTQGPPSTTQSYQLGGVFNRTQTGQFGPPPGLNAFQVYEYFSLPIFLSSVLLFIILRGSCCENNYFSITCSSFQAQSHQPYEVTGMAGYWRLNK